MIKKILVATDGSKVSGKAVAYAAALAKQLGASITLLGVMDTFYLFEPGVSPAVNPARISIPTKDLLRQAIAAYLEEALAECQRYEIKARKVIRTGHPVEEIVKEAVSEKADLIVLGSHGRSALKAAALGSVAYGVLHKDTKIPVLVIRR